MAVTWYRAGTVSVTNGSTTVTGSGSSWVANVNVGDVFHGPDERLYEVAGVSSDTGLTLVSGYLGATQSGQSYAIQPTRGVTAELRSSVSTLISDYQTVKDTAGAGKFADGSAATPGISFTGDQDTGFHRPSTNTLAAAVGGSTKATLSGTGFQVDVPITGAAVQSGAYDDTSDVLLLPGAFGWGTAAWGSPVAYDCDNLTTSGMYIVDDTSTNRPPGSGALFLISTGDRSGNCGQLAFDYTTPGDAGTAGEIWHRRLRTSSWSDWQRIFASANVLGTVSQSGGVPTGNLFEDGSGANGEYVRLPDGTQECWQTLTATFNSASELRASWTFPAAFSAAPVVTNSRGSTDSTTPRNGDVQGAARVQFVSSSSVDLHLSRVIGTTDFVSGDTIEIHARAVGRWF